MNRTTRCLALLLLAMAVRSGAQTADDAFYQAVRQDNLASLKGLVGKQGAGTRDSRGNTPLMYAAAIGSLNAMKLLVEAGAPVNAANDFGATPLMWCAGDLPKVRYLLSKGARVTARSNLGRTPLLIAATYEGSVESARLMIEKGADVRDKDSNGVTVLEAAATVNNLYLARLLLEKGADPNTSDGAGFTPLSAAAMNCERNAPFVKLLLERGASPNVTSIDSLEMMKNGPLGLGRLTPLHLAVGMASFETVDLLVKADANVNARDSRGMTPLMLAIATDRADPRTIRLLLAKGADPNLKSLNGETALDWARKYRDPGVLSALGLEPVPLREPVEAPVAGNIGTAIEKSVALLQSVSATFLEKGGCQACHAQHHTGMAVVAAKAAGVSVNWAKELSESRITASLRGGLEQTLFQLIDPPPGTEGTAFSLLQMTGAGLPPRLSTDSLIFHLAAMQRKEGAWPTYGVIRPPLEDGNFTVTAKAIRALRLSVLPGRKPEFEDRIARAATWLEKAQPRTTEDRTMQILGVRWAGEEAPRKRVTELITLQRSNGGWGQTEHLPTDAYATGSALYALHESGMTAADPVFRRGVDYLLRTQKPDGSWLVKSRAAGFQPYFESGFPHGHDQWISQSGTAWAVIALSFAARNN